MKHTLQLTRPQPTLAPEWRVAMVEGTGIGARFDQNNYKSISEGWDG